MKGSYPRWIYILITIAGIALIITAAIMDLNEAPTAIGAGLLAYGANRLFGEWRVRNNPEYAKKLEIMNQDERLAYIAEKSRSLTLGICVILLAAAGIILIAVELDPYGYTCLYAMCGISVLYFVVYRIVSRKY